MRIDIDRERVERLDPEYILELELASIELSRLHAAAKTIAHGQRIRSMMSGHMILSDGDRNLRKQMHDASMDMSILLDQHCGRVVRGGETDDQAKD